jgi:sulfide:quinone oxidoreductase
MGTEEAEEGRVNGSRGGTRVVIAGAGPAAIETLLGLRHHAGDRVEIDLLAPSDRLQYWPVLVLEPFTSVPSEGISLEALFRRHRVRFRRDFLASVDAEARTARTGGGDEIAYDALVVACGATHVEGVPGAVTVPSVGDVDDIKALLDDLATERIDRVAFALPVGAGWPLPLYELVLMTASEIQKRGRRGAELVLVTPESDPLGLFGKAASESVRELLEASGVEIVTQTYPIAVEAGGLAVRPGGLLGVDRVVALSRVEGPRIGGVPHDANGFIPVDPQGAVVGAAGVYAAGDAVAFPLKQGGIATQQAAAVAESIAARAGAPITPRPFRPVLNGLLLTGGQPRYLRSELTGGYGTSSLLSLEPLWWPPAKIAGRHLGPALAELTGTPIPEPPTDAMPVDVELEVDRVVDR